MRRLVVLCVFVTAVRAYAAEPPRSPPAPVVRKFDNGLTLVVVPLPGARAVAFHTLVRAGSRDEVEPGRSGYAHLFEHLMFRGTTSLSAREYEHRMQSLGVDNNAFTTDDFTLYTPTVPRESLAALIPLEAERFKAFAVGERAYKDETGAVMGEYNKDWASPDTVMEEALRKLAFQKHTYGHTTLGFKRDLARMPDAYAYAKSFFRRFYTPDNCVILAVGDLDPADVGEKVRTAYAGWTGTRTSVEPLVEPPQNAPRAVRIDWDNPTQPMLLVGYKVPAASSLSDLAALTVASSMLFGPTSPLYKRLVLKEQKVVEMSADSEDVVHRDPSLFHVGLRLREGVSWDETLGSLQAAVDTLSREGGDPATLEMHKEHMRNRFELHLQTPAGVAERTASLIAATGSVDGMARFEQELANVTGEAVVRVVSRLLRPEGRNVVMLAYKGQSGGAQK